MIPRAAFPVVERGAGAAGGQTDGGVGMVRTRSVVLAAMAVSVLTFGSPAGAAQRSPLEEPDPVSTVRVHLDGSLMVAAAENAGIDLSGGAERVPDGIEADAVVTDDQIATLKAL